MTFHLNVLNDVANMHDGSFVELLKRFDDANDIINATNIYQPQYIHSHRHQVLYALRRLFLTWKDDKMLKKFQPMIQNAEIDIADIDPLTAFLMVTIDARMITKNIDNSSQQQYSWHCRLCIDLVYQTYQPTQPTVTRVRSFGFISKNNNIPSYIFPLLINVLKWWHGKIIFVIFPEQNQSSTLTMLYHKCINIYTESLKTHFESYFTLDAINEQLQTTVTKSIRFIKYNVKSQIIYKSFDRNDIQGRDIPSFMVALASSLPIPHCYHHIRYLDTFTINIVCSFLQNHCIYNAAYDFLYKCHGHGGIDGGIDDGIDGGIDDHAPCNVNTSSMVIKYKFKTHYYDDLLPY